MYGKLFSMKKTAQNAPIPGQEKRMKQNSAGGYSYTTSQLQQLRRFLIIGSDGGTFYVSPRDLTVDNAKNIIKLIQKIDVTEVINEVLDISEGGKARKNEPAIFTLALILTYGDLEAKKMAVEVMPRICRIGTHLFTLAQYIKELRGWGKMIKKMFTQWYLNQPVDKLTYQAIKYQSRNGWSHRDLLRLNHIKPDSTDRDLLFHYIVSRELEKGERRVAQFPSLKLIEGFERSKNVNTRKKLMKLINEYNLTREMIPTAYLSDPDVQEKLSKQMGLTALIRSLSSFTASGLIHKGNFDLIKQIVDRLTDQVGIRKARVHPLQILDALYTYKKGSGVRGKLSWSPVPQIVDALDKAFYLSFENVPAMGKKIVLALDVSGSMGWSPIHNAILTPREVSAALVMITARREKNYVIKAFSNKMIDIDITPRMRLDQVLKKLSALPFGGTDCALPMIDAKRCKMKDVDAFVVYTDNETWFGKIHPSQALKDYRKYGNSDAKLIVAGMTATNFTIADPKDPGMLDVVGFSTDTPKLIAEYILGNI